MTYRILLVFIGLNFAFTFPLISQDTEVDHRRLIKCTVSTVCAHHLQTPKIDDEFCRHWVETYIDSLDPNRLYFLDTDIAEFQTFVQRLPDLASSGDPDFYELVSNRFRQRADSALVEAIARLDGEFDFSIETEAVIRHQDFASAAEHAERWLSQLKYQLLVEKSSGANLKEAKLFLRSQYGAIHKQVMEFTFEREVGMYLDSFCKAADPHSKYLTKTEFGSFFGLGKSRTYSLGLNTSNRQGRTFVNSVQPAFSNNPSASPLVGCEILAIRSKLGVLHSLRELRPETYWQLVTYGMGQDDWVILELYDEAKLNRISVKWPRRATRTD